jgi:hypothetical protein
MVRESLALLLVGVEVGALWAVGIAVLSLDIWLVSYVFLPHLPPFIFSISFSTARKNIHNSLCNKQDYFFITIYVEQFV